MEYNNQQKLSKHPSEQTRARISASLKGQAKSVEHKEKIRQSLRQFYATDDNFPADKEKTTIQDIML